MKARNGNGKRGSVRGNRHLNLNDQDRYHQWLDADKGKVHESLFRVVPEIEQRQSNLYERFVRLEALYDPNNITVADPLQPQNGILNENIVASNVDTVAASVAATEVEPVVDTDDADWDQQRRARHLEWYAQALMALHGVSEKARIAFKEAAKKGSGLVKVTTDRWNRLCVEHVQPDDIIVDEEETLFGGQPWQLHHRQRNVSKAALAAEFPEYADEIENAGNREGSMVARRVGYAPGRPWECVVIESWYRPIGVPGTKGYKPGRHVKAVDGCDLLDEKWNEDYFPVAHLVWEHRAGGWYGISLGERIANHQRLLNKANWQIDMAIDRIAVPTTYVRTADANLAVKTMSRLGTIAVYKGDVPKTEIPQAVSAEVYNRAEKIKSSAFEESGVSRMAAQSMKPAGLDSGEALRVYRDHTTQRFSSQEAAFEAFVLQIVWLMIAACKRLGEDAPVVMRPSKFGSRKIKWADVDMGDVRIQLSAASTLGKTRAGREQSVLDWAQAGIISQDEARRLIQHPDLERAMSLYTAALESIEYDLEEIADGKSVMPEPYSNVAMAVWRSQQQISLWRMSRAPEKILEAARTYCVQAAWIQAQAKNANASLAAPGPMPGGPSGPMPGAAPVPDAGTPASALAPTAQYQVA